MTAAIARLPNQASSGSSRLPEGPASALRVLMLLSNHTAASTNAGSWQIPEAVLTCLNDTLASISRSGALLSQWDVLVVEIDPEDTDALRAMENLRATIGDRLPVIAAVRDISVSVTRRLMKAGVVDVLPVPFAREDFVQALAAARPHLNAVKPAPAKDRRGDVVAIMGAHGGVGSSMIATQAAQIMAGKKQVLLIDLDLQRGNVAFYMNLKPKMTLADLLNANQALDAEFLRVVSEEHESGARVIGAPDQFLLLDVITPDFIKRLIDAATSQFELVILDLFGVWLEWTAAALQKADVVLLVTELTAAGLTQARRQLDVFEASNMGDRVSVVLNRVPTTLFGGYDTGNAEASLRIANSHAVANDYPTVAEALREGKAFQHVKTGGRLDRDVRRLVSGLTDRLVQVQTAH